MVFNAQENKISTSSNLASDLSRKCRVSIFVLFTQSQCYAKTTIKKLCQFRWCKKLTHILTFYKKTWDLLKMPVFWTFTLSYGMESFGYLIAFIYLPTLAKETIGISIDHGSLLISANGVASIVGRILSGSITDLKGVHPVVVYAGGHLLACLCHFFYPLAPNMGILATLSGKLFSRF